MHAKLSARERVMVEHGVGVGLAIDEAVRGIAASFVRDAESGVEPSAALWRDRIAEAMCALGLGRS
jgi:hypothetical protein